MGLFGSGRPKFGAGIVATPEQEAESQRLAQQFGMGGAPAMAGEWENSFPAMQQQPQQPAQAQRWMDGGKFTGKDAFGLALAAIGDVAALQGGRDPSGVSSITRGMMGAREAQQKAQLAAQQAQQQRAQGREDYAWKAQYDAANAKPVNNDTVADYEFIASTLGQEEAKRYLQGKADPIVNIPLPGGQVYMGPRSRAPGSVPQAPTAPVGRLTPLTGGGAGNGASNFPSGNPLQRPW